MVNNRKIILYIVLLITICITAYTLLVVIPTRLAERSYSAAKKIGEDIRKAFQVTPEVTVNNTIVLQQQSQILELATISQKFQHQYTWTNQWLGSTKKINISGTFEAKAGFDLSKRFTLEINDDNAVIRLPAPELLSITPLHDVTFRDEQGIWNWVTPDDRSAAMNAFTKDANRYAEQAQFVEAAQKVMEERLTDILKSHGKTVKIVYDSPEVIPL